LLLLTLGLAAASAGILYALARYGGDPRGRMHGLGGGLGVASLITGWSFVAYSRAFTRCTQAGIWTRGLGGERRCAWSNVQQIAIRESTRRGVTTYTVLVTTIAGTQFVLGAPVDGGIMPDPAFEDSVRKIRGYWRRAVGAHTDRDFDRAIPVTRVQAGAIRATVGALIRWTVTVVLAFAIIALPFTVRAGLPALQVRLGQGQPGEFVADASVCAVSCYWAGQFAASAGGPRRDGITIGPGARVSRPGDRVAAVELGTETPVYPAGGGTAWIPTAVLLVIIVGCLPLEIIWLAERRRRRRGSDDWMLPMPARPAAARGPRGWASTPLAGTQWIVAGIIVALIAGGAGIAVAAQAVPPARPPAGAVTCADYNAWLLAQHGSGPPQALGQLVRAASEAPPGTLRTDLASLQSDAQTAADQNGTQSGLAALISATSDMNAVTKDCA
jgi:hypothetical protein